MARKISYDQEKVKNLRMSVIDAAQLVMDGNPEIEKWSKYKKELVLKMSPRVLPTLIAGREDDEPLFPKPIYNGRSKGDKK